ncbi:MAG: hypothetical protein QM704_00975 [Anaeromyxobacteraceae bacterium]
MRRRAEGAGAPPTRRSRTSAPQNMTSAIATTSSRTAPVESPSHSGSVKRPMAPERKNGSNAPTVSPKSPTPTSAPRTNRMPSTLSVAAATSEVPGQKPPTTKPTPMMSPPTMPGHRYVGFTHTREKSRRPSEVAPNTSTAATTMAVNIVFRTVRSVR